MGACIIRKARIHDVEDIHRLLLAASKQGLLLPRSLNQIYHGLREFYVAADAEDDSVRGCCALTISWRDLGEVRSLVLTDEARGCGSGRSLVDACLDEAREIGLERVFALTYIPEFFKKFGFGDVSKDSLPQKVWMDCINCPQFPNCDEEAVLLHLNEAQTEDVS
jgi:amino-acid N-acetyltransferase